MKQRTVRELCGEIWAEISMEARAKPDLYAPESWEAQGRLCDLAMAILARHDRSIILQDPAQPALKLPLRLPSEIELLDLENSGPNPLKNLTIRELGDELRLGLWAEALQRRAAGDPIYAPFTDAVFELIMDCAQGVLARYEGTVLVNDSDPPVVPLPMP